MNGINLPLPGDTRESLEKNKSLFQSPGNFGLFYHKFMYVWPQDWELKEEKKKDFLIKISGDLIKNVSKSSTYLEAYILRQRASYQSLKEAGWQGDSFTLKTDSRLILGLGSASVLETGLTLHPLYGFPYLPGSGLKGLARAYAEITGESSPADLRVIFGSEDKDHQQSSKNRLGSVTFMDGLPAVFPKLVVDIMNPHYGEYYQGDKPPADYLSPVPVYFLAVERNMEFSFTLLSSEEHLLRKAVEWLKGGLTMLGAGGKTNAGYGYFKQVVIGAEAGESITGVQSPQAMPEKDPNDAIMRSLLDQARQCKGPGDKSLLALILEKARELPFEYHQKFFRGVMANLPDVMKKNTKIKEFLKEKEKEFIDTEDSSSLI